MRALAPSKNQQRFPVSDRIDSRCREGRNRVTDGISGNRQMLFRLESGGRLFVRQTDGIAFRKPARGSTWNRVLLKQHDGHALPAGGSNCRKRRNAAEPDHHGDGVPFEFVASRTKILARGFQEPDGKSPCIRKGSGFQCHRLHPGGFQDTAFDLSARPDEDNAGIRLAPAECFGNGNPRIKMAARSPAGKDESSLLHGSCEALSAWIPSQRRHSAEFVRPSRLTDFEAGVLQVAKLLANLLIVGRFDVHRDDGNVMLQLAGF